MAPRPGRIHRVIPVDLPYPRTRENAPFRRRIRGHAARGLENAVYHQPRSPKGTPREGRSPAVRRARLISPRWDRVRRRRLVVSGDEGHLRLHRLTYSGAALARPRRRGPGASRDTSRRHQGLHNERSRVRHWAPEPRTSVPRPRERWAARGPAKAKIVSRSHAGPGRRIIAAHGSGITKPATKGQERSPSRRALRVT